MMRLISVRIVALYSIFFCRTNGSAGHGRKVMVFAIGGFRHDYVTDVNLKSFDRFNEEGVTAPFVFPVYPTLSYPNLYSIATGLYAEGHGIVGDIIYDQSSEEFYQPSTEKNATRALRWNKAEPIWTTVEKHGLRAALYWWPGCEIEIDGIHPSICEKHQYGTEPTNFQIDILERIDDVVAMFKNNRLDIALMYTDLMENTALAFGPGSPQMKSMLQMTDNILLQLMEKLDGASLQNEVNILVVSNNGVTTVNHEMTKYLDINEFKENIKFQVMFGPLSMLLPMPGKEEKLFSDLKHANIKGLNVFKKEDIPVEYHIKESKNVLPILLQAQNGYFIKPLQVENSIKQDERVKGPNYTKYKGIGGYDYQVEPNMKTIMFAKGPAFKTAVVAPPLTNVDIYNMICHALGITCLPNNGSKLRIKSMLLDPGEDQENKSPSMSISQHFVLPFVVYALNLYHKYMPL